MFRRVNESATHFLQTFINPVRQIAGVELVRAEWTPRAPDEVDVA